LVPAPRASTTVVVSTLNVISWSRTFTVSELPPMATTVPRATLVSAASAYGVGHQITERSANETPRRTVCI
jgi:hypothetical protein